MRTLAALLCAALLGACASSATTRNTAINADPQTAWIVGRDGRALGRAIFTEAPTGVLIRLEFSERLPAGWHGLHLHQIGDCSDFAEGFQASGAHVRGGDFAHGLRNPDGPEAGDLPNLYARAGAPFAAEFYSRFITLNARALRMPADRRERAPLLDSDGSALVIHAGPDDHQTQPIGGAGERIACAALTQLP